jgi:hypothetical protein
MAWTFCTHSERANVLVFACLYIDIAWCLDGSNLGFRRNKVGCKDFFPKNPNLKNLKGLKARVFETYTCEIPPIRYAREMYACDGYQHTSFVDVEPYRCVLVPFRFQFGLLGKSPYNPAVRKKLGLSLHLMYV